MRQESGILHNRQLPHLYGSSCVVRVPKSSKLYGMNTQLRLGETRDAYITFVGPIPTWPIIKLRRMRVDSIRMYLREPQCVFVALSDSTSRSYCLVKVVFPLTPQTSLSLKSNDRQLMELILHVWPFKWQFSKNHMLFLSHQENVKFISHKFCSENS